MSTAALRTTDKERMYRWFGRLRRTDGLVAIGPTTFLIARYEDVRTVLTARTCSSERTFENEIRIAALESAGLAQQWSRSIIPSFISSTLLFIDPPSHTRLRRVVARHFLQSSLQSVDQRSHELLADLLPKASGSFDVIATFARALPVLVMCDLLGLPIEDRPLLLEWSLDAAALLDVNIDSRTITKGDAALSSMRTYFATRFGDDCEATGPIATDLAAARDREASLDELTTLAALLFVAGHETAKNLIGSLIHLLCANAHVVERLRSDPAGIDAAVEETLRLESPIQIVARRTTEPLVLDDQVVPPESTLLCLLGSANRDEACFTDAKAFMLTRPQRHLAFGIGPHFCLGAALARLEARAVVFALLSNYRAIEVEDVSSPPRTLLCGPDRLVVRATRR